MQLGVPVIATDKPALEDYCSDTMLYTAPNDVDDLGHQMLLLYKDESLRSSLVRSAKEKVSHFSWSATAEKLMVTIEATARR
jgi:glycosyltransferase involved in cell wall biosynthesis